VIVIRFIDLIFAATNGRRRIVTDEQWGRLRKMSAPERSELVREAMRRLFALHRLRAEALTYRVVHGKGVEEIASIMGVTKGTVSKWCSKAKEVFQDTVADLLSDRERESILIWCDGGNQKCPKN
jgi:DNA-directed RNA polymerase specialized sigma24 family protein